MIVSMGLNLTLAGAGEGVVTEGVDLEAFDDDDDDVMEGVDDEEGVERVFEDADV
jgi:hypothetical protein